jgi:hypothetical protein
MDQLYIEYSSICGCYWVMRIPAWAIELAGDAGEWTNDDGDTYVPSEMATFEVQQDFRTRAAAQQYIDSLEG